MKSLTKTLIALSLTISSTLVLADVVNVTFVNTADKGVGAQQIEMFNIDTNQLGELFNGQIHVIKKDGSTAPQKMVSNGTGAFILLRMFPANTLKSLGTDSQALVLFAPKIDDKNSMLSCSTAKTPIPGSSVCKSELYTYTITGTHNYPVVTITKTS